MIDYEKYRQAKKEARRYKRKYMRYKAALDMVVSELERIKTKKTGLVLDLIHEHFPEVGDGQDV